MILQTNNKVELTKIHYYGRNVDTINTISRQIYNKQNNIIIKNNIFGHRWILKVNEPPNQKKSNKIKLVLYIFVFCCIVIAICFGIYFTLEPYFKITTNSIAGTENCTKNSNSNSNNIYSKTFTTQLPENQTITTLLQRIVTKKPFHKRNICGECDRNDNVCLKMNETEKPKCLKTVDKKDPTGCGGLCKLNIEFCQLLDVQSRVYQCSQIKNSLHCPNGTFNCGNMCIFIKNRCDGIIHCSNYSDEKNCDCDLKKNFQCGNSTSCLENKRKCDGKVDCWDKSDEKYCNKECKENELPCINGQCIPKDHFCDGIFQCADLSDEPKGCQL